MALLVPDADVQRGAVVRGFYASEGK